MSDEDLMRALSEIGTRLLTTESRSGFLSMLRWVAINKTDEFDLWALREALASEKVARIPDGWFVGTFDCQLIVAVFEQDDTHSDLPKWRRLAHLFDASENALFVEYRRHRNGPLAMKLEGDLCMESYGGPGESTHVAFTPWTGIVSEMRMPTRYATQQTDAALRKQRMETDET